MGHALIAGVISEVSMASFAMQAVLWAELLQTEAQGKYGRVADHCKTDTGV